MANPDLQIRGGPGPGPEIEEEEGGGGGSKNFCLALWASVWSKNVGGGGGTPGAPPLDPPAYKLN